MIDTQALIDRMVLGLRGGATQLPPDVVAALEAAYEREDTDTARMQLKAILDNVALARDEWVPLCQDTGIQVFYVTAGYGFPHLSDVVRAIPLAIARATSEVPLRPNTVNPFTGANPKDNLGEHMPAVTIDLEEGDGCRITIFPKGGGSENMSALWMLTPAAGFKGLKRKVLEHVQWAAGKPCTPVVLGIGIGGGADMAVKLAKRALLRPVGSVNPDGDAAALESELLEDVNALGIGPMGLGGRTTALAVHVEYAHRHPATFPTALVVQCWCDRRAVIVLDREGRAIG
ncbi:MAG: fumarate hydratase [Thermoplasmata archaeon]|nr:fumarate hydratase [Thermoplasmata archaeon]